MLKCIYLRRVSTVNPPVRPSAVLRPVTAPRTTGPPKHLGADLSSSKPKPGSPSTGAGHRPPPIYSPRLGAPPSPAPTRISPKPSPHDSPKPAPKPLGSPRPNPAPGPADAATRRAKRRVKGRASQPSETGHDTPANPKTDPWSWTVWFHGRVEFNRRLNSQKSKISLNSSK